MRLHRGASEILSPFRQPDPETIDWFDTATIAQQLGPKSFQGFYVTFGVQALKFVVNVVATAVLARLLTPTDFGLIALVISVTGVAHLFNDLGLSLATIQRPDLSHREASCVFWVTAISGSVIAILVAASAPLLSVVFKDSRLAAVTPVISLVFLFGALGGQHQALLKRHMRFGTIGLIEFSSVLLSYLVAIILAFLGFSYWALVLQQVFSFGCIAVASWIACSWRPSWPAWVPSIKNMIGFGGNVSLSNFLNYLCRNVDNVLIGRFCGAQTLGLYSKAYQLLLLPVWQINTPMLSAMTPALSRVQFEPDRFKRIYLKSIMAISSIGMPLVVFMFVRADQIILAALGRDWMGAVPLFRMLAPAAFMDTFNIAAGLVLITLGQVNRQLRLSIVSAVVIILAFCIGIHWGAEGVAIAFSAVLVLSRIPALAYCFAHSPVRTTDFLLILWRPAVCSILAGVFLYLAVPGDLAPTTLRIIVSLIRDFSLFAVLLGASWLIMPRGWSTVRETFATIARLIRSEAPLTS